MNKATQVISFRLTESEIQALEAQKQPGESSSQVAQRLLKNLLGIPTPNSVNTMSTNTMSTNTVSTLSTEQLEKLDNLSNIPTRNEFHDLKELVNSFKLSLMREIQNRDKGISLLAQQVAELTERLDTMPVSGIDKETLSDAKETVLKNWRTSKAPERKERIGQALDKLINIVSPPETDTIPQPETQPEVACVPESKNKIDWKVGDKCSVKMPSGTVIRGAEIASIQKSKGTCKVFVPETETHFTAELTDLILPSPDKKPDNRTDISPRTRKRKPLTAWEEWEEICTDNIIELDELWHEK